MKKTFDAPVAQTLMGRSSLTDDDEFLKAQIRSLENEIRSLRETLRDRFAMAALDVSKRTMTYDQMAMNDMETIIAIGAYNIADAMLEARKP
ncbi:MAG: hypothetical protein IPG16_02220 [Comamonadaceae bacterium]|nr:hypothetical protein [Comamonadaceae bacterium]